MPSDNSRPLGKRAVDESSPRVLRHRKNGLDDGETLALNRAVTCVLATLINSLARPTSTDYSNGIACAILTTAHGRRRAARLSRDSPGGAQVLIQTRACSNSLTWKALTSAF